MKQAAGEANITVIAIVLIGIIAAVGALFIPRLIENMKAKQCCVDHSGYISGGLCKSWEGNEEEDISLEILISNTDNICEK